MQQALFEPSLPTPSDAAPDPVSGASAQALRRWWHLHGQARRAGRGVEPLLVTPRFLARITSPVCPVTRTVLAPHASVVLPLRADATIAAGHLVTVGSTAAAAATGLDWLRCWATAERLAGQPAAREGGLDSHQWQRLALLHTFVQPLTPAQAATLPLVVLPPERLRVLSPVQGLQVAITLLLARPQRADRLCRLALLAADEDTRQALRVFGLTLLARCPAGLDGLAPLARRQALEDLWADALLLRRWQRLALRLTDTSAADLLVQAQRQGILGGGWRPIDRTTAVDGWDLPANADGAERRQPGPRRQRSESAHDRRRAAPSVSPHAPAAPVLAPLVLGPGDGRQHADAGAASAADR